MSTSTIILQKYINNNSKIINSDHYHLLNKIIEFYSSDKCKFITNRKINISNVLNHYYIIEEKNTSKLIESQYLYYHKFIELHNHINDLLIYNKYSNSHYVIAQLYNIAAYVLPNYTSLVMFSSEVLNEFAVLLDIVLSIHKKHNIAINREVYIILSTFQSNLTKNINIRNKKNY
jgi:hypothetical protein